MLTDNDFDIVYLSEYLKQPLSNKDKGLYKMFSDLEAILNKEAYVVHTLPYKNRYTITGQLSVWYRDYMPVQTGESIYIAFNYNPDYLQCQKYNGYIPDSGFACNAVGLDNFISSEIKLDGGNIVRCEDKVIMIDKFLYENDHPRELLDFLEKAFDAEIILLPWDRREYLGHSDGIVRYIGGHQVIMPMYGDPAKNKTDRHYNTTYQKILERHGISVIQLNFDGIDNEKTDYRWAYVNWLQLNGLIIIPVFNDMPRANEYALNMISHHAKQNGINVKTVEATALVKNGGALNCASWTIKGTKSNFD